MDQIAVFAEQIIAENREEIFGFGFVPKQRWIQQIQHGLNRLGFGHGFRQQTVVADTFHHVDFGALFPYHQLAFAVAVDGDQDVVHDVIF